MRMADCLPCLPHGLVGDGAAIDDGPILTGSRVTRDRLALGEVEAASEADRLDGHCSASRSSSPSNTWVAAPRMRIGCPGAQSTVRLPPVISTLTGDCARFVAMAATALAQAPVPQASVSPAPRSNVRNFRRSWI